MMVKDLKSGDAYRADHLLEGSLNVNLSHLVLEHIEELLKNPKLTEEEKLKLQTDIARADDYSCEELGEKLKEYGVKSPEGNEISEPYPFNLMFSSHIGATGKLKGYEGC
jgi:glycyl-tRNA synthetase